MDIIFQNLETNNIDVKVSNEKKQNSFTNSLSTEKKQAERIIDNLELEQLAEKLNRTERSILSKIDPNGYEELLQKLEGDIRNHIKIQHQYRIYTDSLKLKLEELEKINNDQKSIIANLNEVYYIIICYY